MEEEEEEEECLPINELEVRKGRTHRKMGCRRNEANKDSDSKE